jgi:hypothetical protein
MGVSRNQRIVGGTILFLMFASIPLILMIDRNQWRLKLEGDTDVTHYAETLKRLGYPSEAALSHFPAQIPANASNFHFYYVYNSANDRQIELRYQIPPADLSGLVANFQLMAKASAPDIAHQKKIGGGRLPIHQFRNSTNSGFDNLPPDFQVYLLSAQYDFDYIGRRAKIQGRTRGVAISEKRSEIIYWLEDW